MIVLDASLMVEWLATREGHILAREVYGSLPDVPIRVPGHWALEICNALRPDIRSKKLSISDLHVIMERFDLLDIRAEPPVDLDDIGPLAQFAVAHDLTAYDAAYVQLALQNNATLATLDKAMRAAAQRLNIPVLPV